MRTLVTLLLIIGASLKADAQNRHALIIAIDQYQDTRWRPTHAGHDLPLLRHALESKGFPTGNIDTLQDKAANKAGIVQALQQLENRLSPGDFAWVHVSAHGQQLPDDSGDEIDGLDESIVPYDAPKTYKTDDPAPGARHLRDDELNSLLNAICQKIGPDGHLMVTLDVCHAGTGTRAYSTHYRGTDEPAYTNSLEKSKQSPPDQRYTLGGDSRNSFAIFAAAPHERNFTCTPGDGRQYGSLSYALARALAATMPGETCQDLFDRVRVEMSILAPGQHPQSEGDGGRVLLGAGFEKIPEFAPFRINSRSARITTVEVDGGLLANVHPGSVYAFSPPEDSSTKPVVRGNAEACDGLSCTVHLESEVPADSLKTWRAELVERNFGNMRLNVKLDLPNGLIQEAILDSLEKRPEFQLDSVNFDLVLLQENKRIHLATPAGFHFPENYDPSPTSISRIINQMHAYMKGLYLRRVRLEDPSKQIDLELNIWLVKTENKGTKEKPLWTFVDTLITLPNRQDSSRVPFLREGEHFVVHITNRGYKAAYFNLLDFQPDGVVNAILPNDNFSKLTINDLQIQPDSTWRSENYPQLTNEGVFDVFPPHGPETFLLVAADEPIDLRAALQPARQVRGDGKKFTHPLELMFRGVHMATRSEGPLTLQIERAQTVILPFNIKPKSNE